MRLIIAIFMILLSSTVLAKDTDKCPFKDKKSTTIIIGWISGDRTIVQSSASGIVKTEVGSFKPVAEISNNAISETIGDTISENQVFWSVLNLRISTKLSSVSSFWNRRGIDHCVYYASIDNREIKKWTLLINEPLVIFNEPSQQDISEFYQLNTTCVDQGDYDEHEKPPCSKPQLLAVTDINKDGKSEFWATEPYTWDTGLTVWEHNNSVITPILQVCPGCSD